MLTKVKAALRLTVNDYDDELTLMILSALSDLGISDINRTLLTSTSTDELITMAVITYCRMHFGTPDDYERLERSYKEQKAQLITATGYGFPEVQQW